MPNFVILLPPSQGKHPGGNPFAPDMFDYRASSTFNYFSELNPDRRELIAALHRTMEDEQDLESLFGVEGKLLDEVIQVNREVLQGPLMSALDRYSTGVMYQAMDFAGLPTGAQRRLLENGIIFSGMFGLLRPDDLIPNYCLRMDASVPGIGSLTEFWRARMSGVLNRTLADKLVWNLLPSTTREAWDDDHAYRTMVLVQFEREVGGERSVVTRGLKPLCGQLVNFIVRETLEEVERLNGWTHPEGYRYDPESSRFDADSRTAVAVMVKRG